MDSNSVSLFTNSHENVSKLLDKRSIAVSILFILLGAAAFYFSIIEHACNDNWSCMSFVGSIPFVLEKL